MIVTAMLAASVTGPVYRTEHAPGTRHYSYEVTQTVEHGPIHGYRTAFDLKSSGGAIYAVIRKSSVLDGNWKSVEIDRPCRAAKHGNGASLARVKLSPLPPLAAKTLGGSFVAVCAPAGIFFPLTDILNIVLIPSSHFRATELRQVGQSLHFAGFETALDRDGVARRARDR